MRSKFLRHLLRPSSEIISCFIFSLFAGIKLIFEMVRLRFSVAYALAILVGICQSYKIGLGRADVTGPSVEIAFVSFGA